MRALAEAWGSRFIDIGPVGHLNPASGYGEWPGAEALLDVLGGMGRHQGGPRRLTSRSRTTARPSHQDGVAGASRTRGAVLVAVPADRLAPDPKGTGHCPHR